MVHEYLSPQGDTLWVQRTTGPISAAGTSVTVDDVAPTGDRYKLSICEIFGEAVELFAKYIVSDAASSGASDLIASLPLILPNGRGMYCAPQQSP